MPRQLLLEVRTDTSNFDMHAPCAALQSSDEALWIAQEHANCAREVVLPNGAVALMVNLGPEQWVLNHDRDPGRVDRGPPARPL